MATFSPETWVIIALVSLVGVTAVLHVLARYLLAERELHDLRIKVQEVRKGYARRLAEMAARGEGPADEVLEVEPVDDQPETAGAIGHAPRRAAA